MRRFPWFTSPWSEPQCISSTVSVLNEDRSQGQSVVRVSLLPCLPTLSEKKKATQNPPVQSMSQLLSVRRIRRHLWYSQGVKIKAGSLSTSCSANTHFPLQSPHPPPPSPTDGRSHLNLIILPLISSVFDRAQFSVLAAVLRRCSRHFYSRAIHSCQLRYRCICVSYTFSLHLMLTDGH